MTPPKFQRKADLFHDAELKNWPQFERDLKTKGFQKAMLSHGLSDDKLKSYVQNYGAFLTARKVVGKVKSFSSSKMHTIKKLPGGRLGCSCRDWQFKHSHQGTDCKHIRSLAQGTKVASMRSIDRDVLKSFRLELEKLSARRGAKEIQKLVNAGNIEEASRLATTSGVLKPTAAGAELRAPRAREDFSTELPAYNTPGRRAARKKLEKERREEARKRGVSKGDLGRGGEGLATLVAHPEYGVSVRKLFQPHGLSSDRMISRKEHVGRLLRDDPRFAKFYGAEQTARGTPMHFSEYLRGTPLTQKENPIEKKRFVQRLRPKLREFIEGILPSRFKKPIKGDADVRQARADALRSIRSTGYHGAQDIRAGNMMRMPDGSIRVFDYLPSRRGEFENPVKVRRMPGGGENIMQPTPQGAGLLTGGESPITNSQFKKMLLTPKPQLPPPPPPVEASSAMSSGVGTATATPKAMAQNVVRKEYVPEGQRRLPGARPPPPAPADASQASLLPSRFVQSVRPPPPPPSASMSR